MVKLFRNIAAGMLITALGFPTTVFAGEGDILAEDTLTKVEELQEGQDVFDNLIETGGDAADPGDQDTGGQDTGGQDTEVPQEPEWKKGWNEYEGNWYYCQKDTERYFGWVKSKSKWYYLDGSDEEHPGIMACDGLKKIDGRYYAFDADGAMQTGWVKREEGWYYANGSGALCSGWVKVKGKWYYLDPDNEVYPLLMKSSEMATIKEKCYSFSASGAMQTGWIKRGEGWYYADNSGALCSGWVKVKGKWYYLDPDNEEHPLLMKSSEIATIEGERYSFDGNGAMQVGWVSKEEGWYYARGNGAMHTGWQVVKGKWYYLDGENADYPGLMLKSCKRVIGGIEYTFTSSGAMQTGWEYVDGKGWKYYSKSGIQMTEWQKVNGKWYYMDPSNEGIMVSDCWKEISGKRYFLNEDGSMAANWLYRDGYWYYMGSDGAMKTGWQYDGKYWYYLYKKEDPGSTGWGTMAKNTTIDGYVIGPNGQWDTAYYYANNVLNSIGRSLRNAYNWSVGLEYYTMTDNASPGSCWFATYGFKNGKGNCYVMAATFYYMAKLLGYDAHQISGYVLSRSGGREPHSWVEIDMNGTTYVFDPSFGQGVGRNGYQIRYGASGTWRYTDYYRMN